MRQKSIVGFQDNSVPTGVLLADSGLVMMSVEKIKKIKTRPKVGHHLNVSTDTVTAARKHPNPKESKAAGPC